MSASEKCKIVIEGENKWMTVIENALVNRYCYPNPLRICSLEALRILFEFFLSNHVCQSSNRNYCAEDT